MKSISTVVPQTSGQGVSRYSYQKGYALGQHGLGSSKIKPYRPIKDGPPISFAKPPRSSLIVQAAPSKSSPLDLTPRADIGEDMAAQWDKS